VKDKDTARFDICQIYFLEVSKYICAIPLPKRLASSKLSLGDDENTNDGKFTLYFTKKILLWASGQVINFYQEIFIGMNKVLEYLPNNITYKEESAVVINAGTVLFTQSIKKEMWRWQKNLLI
jgi:hypothetical protein